MSVNIGVGFNPSTQEPIDARTVVANNTERLALPWYKLYKGLLVFQADENRYYACTDPGNEKHCNLQRKHFKILCCIYTVYVCMRQTSKDGFRRGIQQADGCPEPWVSYCSQGKTTTCQCRYIPRDYGDAG